MRYLIIVAAFLIGLSWLGIVGLSNQSRAIECCSTDSGVSKQVVLRKFGSPQSEKKIGKPHLIGTPAVIENADEILMYTYGEESIQMGFANGKYIGCFPSKTDLENRFKVANLFDSSRKKSLSAGWGG